MEKRLVTRYAMRSAEAADENQRRVEGVFVELAAAQPNNVSYIVLRLADDLGQPSVRYRSSQRSAARSYFGDPRSA